WIAQELDGFLPRALGRRDVALAVLRLPGEPFAQGVNLDSLARFREERRLSRRDRSLDELVDTDLQSLPEGAERQPQGRCRLSLAGAGIHDEQSLLARRARHFALERFVPADHLLFMGDVHVVWHLIAPFLSSSTRFARVSSCRWRFRRSRPGDSAIARAWPRCSCDRSKSLARLETQRCRPCDLRASRATPAGKSHSRTGRGDSTPRSDRPRKWHRRRLRQRLRRDARSATTGGDRSSAPDGSHSPRRRGLGSRGSGGHPARLREPGWSAWLARRWFRPAVAPDQRFRPTTIRFAAGRGV